MEGGEPTWLHFLSTNRWTNAGTNVKLFLRGWYQAVYTHFTEAENDIRISISCSCLRSAGPWTEEALERIEFRTVVPSWSFLASSSLSSVIFASKTKAELDCAAVVTMRPRVACTSYRKYAHVRVRVLVRDHVSACAEKVLAIRPRRCASAKRSRRIRACAKPAMKTSVHSVIRNV